nr:hypothetical protein [Paucibacter sp. M5-1]MCZ7880219.1 hypothetical protein [Paucibacter sp. M5-1]
MTRISSAGLSLPTQHLSPVRTTTPARPTAVAVESSASPASTRVTLDAAAAATVVYAKPRAVDEAPFATTRSWASPQQDAISSLMARNGSAGGLAGRWSGLGGALLSHLASTQSDYRQTLVDDSAPPAADAMATDRTSALAAPALDGADAAQVSLKIRTLSGQTVALKIATSEHEGRSGLQVEIGSSGPLSKAEREALARLAEGLDKALDGLGQAGALKLDLAGLMDYDSSALTSVDLRVSNPKPSQALASFALHLGTDRKTLALAGKAGEIAVDLDMNTPVGRGSAQQRQSAIQQHLQQFDAAAQRSRADAALVALFKNAFTQLHAQPPSQVASRAEALSPALERQVQPLLSGLMDFQASFGGDFERSNPAGAVTEAGRADYQLSQKTTLRRHGAADDRSITQTQSEKLDAHAKKSRTGGMLDTRSGNYDLNKIQDRNTVTTLIEATEGQLTRALKKTDQHQLHTYEKLVDHRVEERRDTPLDKNTLKRLR